jgi:hypothetical protein
MTGGVGHSRQRQGLEKGVGSEALTGDERRGGSFELLPVFLRKKKGEDCGRVLQPW